MRTWARWWSSWMLRLWDAVLRVFGCRVPSGVRVEERDVRLIRPTWGLFGIVGRIVRVVKGPVAPVEVIESQAEFEAKFGSPQHRLKAEWTLEEASDLEKGYMLVPIPGIEEYESYPLTVVRNAMRGYSAWAPGVPGAKPGRGWTRMEACLEAQNNLMSYRIAQEMADQLKRMIARGLGRRYAATEINPDYYGKVQIA